VPFKTVADDELLVQIPPPVASVKTIELFTQTVALEGEIAAGIVLIVIGWTTIVGPQALVIV